MCSFTSLFLSFSLWLSGSIDLIFFQAYFKLNCMIRTQDCHYIFLDIDLPSLRLLVPPIKKDNVSKIAYQTCLLFNVVIIHIICVWINFPVHASNYDTRSSLVGFYFYECFNGKYFHFVNDFIECFAWNSNLDRSVKFSLLYFLFWLELCVKNWFVLQKYIFSLITFIRVDRKKFCISTTKKSRWQCICQSCFFDCPAEIRLGFKCTYILFTFNLYQIHYNYSAVLMHLLRIILYVSECSKIKFIIPNMLTH